VELCVAGKTIPAGLSGQKGICVAALCNRSGGHFSRNSAGLRLIRDHYCVTALCSRGSRGTVLLTIPVHIQCFENKWCQKRTRSQNLPNCFKILVVENALCRYPQLYPQAKKQRGSMPIFAVLTIFFYLSASTIVHCNLNIANVNICILAIASARPWGRSRPELVVGSICSELPLLTIPA